MDDQRITAALNKTDDILATLTGGLGVYTSGIRQELRSSVKPILEEVTLSISGTEVFITRVTVKISQDAEYHILSAYYHASPGLIAIILGIYGFIQTVIQVVNTINSILQVITGETLAYWLNMLIPGFQEAWNDIMNKISQFSGALGWGVDGVHHILNVAKTSADVWGIFNGKGVPAINVERYARLDVIMNNYSNELQLWQSEPGKQIAALEASMATRTLNGCSGIMNNITDKLSQFGNKAEEAFKGVGTISSELLAIRNDMPAFIAKNIPSGIWDGILRVDTAINDRILPALTAINDKIDELDAVMEKYRAKATELADKISHPGDMLAEINNLPDYVRKDQLVKIDGITSSLISEQNAVDYAAIEPDLRAFAVTAEALSHPPAPLPFMELELPGRSPGITPEPRESWFVGDY